MAALPKPSRAEEMALTKAAIAQTKALTAGLKKEIEQDRAAFVSEFPQTRDFSKIQQAAHGSFLEQLFHEVNTTTLDKRIDGTVLKEMAVKAAGNVSAYDLSDGREVDTDIKTGARKMSTDPEVVKRRESLKAGAFVAFNKVSDSQAQEFANHLRAMHQVLAFGNDAGATVEDQKRPVIKLYNNRDYQIETARAIRDKLDGVNLGPVVKDVDIAEHLKTGMGTFQNPQTFPKKQVTSHPADTAIHPGKGISISGAVHVEDHNGAPPLKVPQSLSSKKPSGPQ